MSNSTKTPEQCQREHDEFVVAMAAYEAAEARGAIELAELDKKIRTRRATLRFTDEEEPS